MNCEKLIAVAREVRLQAYAPYSRFSVGAALLTDDEMIFSGCNVENLSYGLSLCAERVAVSSAVAAGKREFLALAVIADTEKPISPCGACRQFLAEFNPRMRLFLCTVRGKREEFDLDFLLPRAQTGILNRP